MCRYLDSSRDNQEDYLYNHTDSLQQQADYLDIFRVK